MKLVARFLMLASCLCLSFVAVTPATAVAAREKQTLEVADRLHTPPEGSAERQALMDGLRRHWQSTRNPGDGRPYRGKITFHVGYLKVHHGWAWVYADPRSSDPGEGFPENSGFLLHLTADRWQVMKMPPMDDDQDGSLDPSARDIERIRKMYPSIATDIFPNQRRR